MKSWEMKAEPLTTSQLDRWLAGKMPRRHLAIPFGGPIAKADAPLGADPEGEWFDADTDLYGPFPWLRQSRERLVDWHHTTFGAHGGYEDPTGVMKGAILGRIILDAEPSEEEIDGETYAGVWADFWANAGEKRRSLVAALERRSAPLFGSSQPVAKAVRIDPSGHIAVWPVRFHTITTSPINPYAVLPPMKASILDDPYLAELSVGALRAFLTGEDNPTSDLLPTSSRGEGEAKAGRVLSGINEQDIDEAVNAMLGAAERLRNVLSRQRMETT